MISDVQDILHARAADDGNISVEKIMNPDGKQKKKSMKKSLEQVKRPEGMHRELYNLLVIDKNSASPLMPTLTSTHHGGYRNSKAILGLRRAREWKMVPFSNPAREKDNLTLYHWRRSDKLEEPYPFARFNRSVEVPSYSPEEYDRILAAPGWTQPETDHLMDLASRFDLRWFIMQDRWDRAKFSRKISVEDMKERYYSIHNALLKARAGPDVEPNLLKFDADHERRRKLQLEKLWNRTEEQVEEEERLESDLRKIEARRKERERKAQDLQKLITAADRPPSLSSSNSNALQQKKKFPKNARPSISGSMSPANDSTVGLKFPEFKSSGPYLRSQKMKLPQQAGQKKLKIVELAMDKLKLEHNPTATEDIVTQFNELRSDILLLYDLKTALTSCEFELEAQKHQYHAATGTVQQFINHRIQMLEIPPSLRVNQITDSSPKRPIASCMDMGQNAFPTRRRKAAMEQPSVLKKLRRLP